MAGKKLGRGLDSLIEETGQDAGSGSEGKEIPIRDIRANPYQPRRHFDEVALGELADSIREHGILQPVVLRRRERGFELIAGERRWRAAQRVGLAVLPAVIREATDAQMLELALVENLQREDLDPVEKAVAYRQYVDELSLTHEEAARRLGKDRSTITNQLRLLELEEDLQAMVSRGTLSMGHARALLGAPDAETRRRIARMIEREGLSVRETEKKVRDARGSRTSAPASGPSSLSPWLEKLEGRIRDRFATRAKIEGTKEKGKIVLNYASMGELSRILEMLLDEQLE